MEFRLVQMQFNNTCPTLRQYLCLNPGKKIIFTITFYILTKEHFFDCIVSVTKGVVGGGKTFKISPKITTYF
jgi:hypothetical protein